MIQWMLEIYTLDDVLLWLKKKSTQNILFFLTTVLDLIKSIVSVHHFKGNFAAVVPAYHTETTTGN